MVCFIALLIIGIHLLTVMRYPEVNVDEAILASRAWAFNQTGHQFGPLDFNITDHLKDYWIVNDWFVTVLQGLVLKLSISPELIWVRLLSLLFGFLLLGINFVIGNKLGGKPLAVTSTLLLAFSKAFFISAHLARSDIFTATFAYSALAVMICASGRYFWINLIAGVLVGVAVETHLNGLIFIPVLISLVLVDNGRDFWHKPGFWGLMAGLFIGAGYYTIIHILPAPETYFQAKNLIFGKEYLPPLLKFDFGIISRGFSEAGLLLMAGLFSLVPLGIIQIVNLIRRLDQQLSKIVLVNCLLFLGVALIFPKKNVHYSILLAPAFIWLVAGFCLDHFRLPWKSSVWNYIQRVLVLGCLGGALAFSIIPTIPDNYQKYQNAQNKVNEYILNGDTVMGNQWYWFGLYNYKYYSWELLFLYPRLYPEKTLADSFEHYRPDVFIVDRQMETLIVDNVAPGTIWYRYHLPKTEMDEYLSKNALLTAKIKTDLYGEIKIYRFTW
jgi:4-amino-4-deoxy-L-arabinose transferase-like glycosyltransferase